MRFISRFLALLAIAALAFIAYVKSDEIKAKIMPPSPYESMQGFYEEKDVFFLGQKYTCETFTVTSNDSAALQQLRSKAGTESSVNRLDGQGRLVLNMRLNDTDQSLQNPLLKSSEERPVAVKAKILEQSPVITDPCESAILILK